MFAQALEYMVMIICMIAGWRRFQWSFHGVAFLEWDGAILEIGMGYENDKLM
jgi:hypothetical protein